MEKGAPREHEASVEADADTAQELILDMIARKERDQETASLPELVEKLVASGYTEEDAVELVDDLIEKSIIVLNDNFSVSIKVNMLVD